MTEAPIGVLLINLGTPDAPSKHAVRRFLSLFLSDPFVIELPSLLRKIIVNLFILPFRPKRTAALYQKIWLPHGSPLLYHSEQFKTRLTKLLGEKYIVALGMRYGNPSLELAYEQIRHCKKIIIFPLFPQYSSAATGSAIAKAREIITNPLQPHCLQIINSFFDKAQYIEAMTHIIQKTKCDFNPDFILFSYHGLPERTVTKSCDAKQCDRIHSCLTQTKTVSCYRAQCFKTTEAIAHHLQLSKTQYATAFQSRLGRVQWVRPYTDLALEDLLSKGVKRLMLVCPSFVVDCLETLEEINIRLRERWLALGGESFQLVPSLNADPGWIKQASLILKSL